MVFRRRKTQERTQEKKPGSTSRTGSQTTSLNWGIQPEPVLSADQCITGLLGFVRTPPDNNRE